MMEVIVWGPEGEGEGVMKDHIAATQREGKWHGLFFVTCSTPSGCPRPVLQLSSTMGSDSVEEAVWNMARFFSESELREIETPDFSDPDLVELRRKARPIPTCEDCSAALSIVEPGDLR